ncbi:MAG: hypothetical protein JPMHGGIA_00389 [Saprospiraceae bacterium]|nr:hypothetical protein [Saprospiraceae bacterium]
MFACSHFKDELKGDHFLFRAEILKILIVLCTIQSTLSGQSEFFNCPVDSVTQHPDSIYNPDPCIDVEEIMEELDGGDHCRLIWINLNVHFFVDDDSTNNLITPKGHVVSEANKLAEDLVNEANYYLYLNEIQINQPGAIKLCNPFQYVLRGVYIHIVSSPADVDARSKINIMHQTFGVNKASEFNLYISPCDGCSGAAGGEGGTITYFNLAELGGNILNHEWGHTMGIMHSWREDFLDDTPPIHFDLDRNCDGDYYDIREKEQQCFGKIISSDPAEPGTDGIGMSYNSSTERWYNNINDCLETPPCPTSPCCLDEFQNNNVMAYNACQCAFTYQQLRKTLMQLLSYKCGYINTIQTDRSCWAPSAFISLPKPGQSDYGYCSTCFDFTASYNDQKHRVKVYELSGGNSILVYDPGWVQSPATTLCFKNYGLSIGSGRYLKPGTHYRIELTVGRTNDCIDPVTFSRNFTTGTCEPDVYVPPFSEMIISPNPSSGNIQLNYDAFESEEFAIFAVNQANGQVSLLSNSMYATNEGENEYELLVSSLFNGTYTLFMIGIENNHYQTLVKQ